MKELVGSFTARKKRGRSYAYEAQPTALTTHTPTHMEVEKVCAVCKKSQRRSSGLHVSRTRDGCLECNIAVHFECWQQHFTHISGKEEETT